jgi:hypothetical protein
MTYSRNSVWISCLAGALSAVGCSGKTAATAAQNADAGQTRTDTSSGTGTALGGAQAQDTSFSGTGGTNTGSTKTDASAIDASNPELVVVDAGSYAGADDPRPTGTCTPGERLGTCNSSGTGCPGSSFYCTAAGTWSLCGCIGCRLMLLSDICGWAIVSASGLELVPAGRAPTAVVSRIDSSATTELPFVADQNACTQNGGWYAVTDPVSAGLLPTARTFYLCPSSCNEHQQNSAVGFELYLPSCFTG